MQQRPIHPLLPKGVRKFPPRIPNKLSKHKTALSVRIELHYAKLGVIGRWDWARYCRIASFTNLTVYELASLICWSHIEVDHAKKNNRFPSAVCMLLTLLEAQLLKEFTHDVIQNPFPSFQNDPPKGS